MVETIIYHIETVVGYVHGSSGCTWFNIKLKVLENTQIISPKVIDMGMCLVEEDAQGSVESSDE